ncbi:MAG: glutathione peroxidase [Flavobacteriia bacterium]|nr:glutathione peroxidase [Flavobacteriia bacterium]
MKRFILFAFLLFAMLANTQSIHSYKVNDINGKEFDFATLKGKKIMIVNTASECGLTPQYSDLEKLYQKYKDHNFVIIAFPSNDFLNQEPGSDAEIATFCQKNYGVTFHIMSKIHVKGDQRHPIYDFLTQKEKNGIANSDVKWNFHKFLVDENGKYVKNLSPKTKPFDDEIIQWIERK